MSDPALPSIVLDLLAASELIVGIFDERDVLRFANTAFENAYHLRPDGRSTWLDLMRNNHAHQRGTVVGAEDFETWFAATKSRRGKLPFRAFESDLHDGRWIWMTETLLGNGWMLCVASDITSFHQDGRALRQAYDQALRTAQTDALTGLSNRTHIVRQADQLIAQGRPFALALLDLDHFKRINDLYGHSAGDEVIRDFARHLQVSIRREDGAGRVGGEEFTLLLSGCGREQSEAIVSRLFARVRAARPLANAPGQGYTASAGLVLHQPGESATQLYNRADHALYRAKDAGRDQWAWAAAS